jgi:hypothetical protein
MQNQTLHQKKVARDIKKEVLTLSEMGLEDYEIDYLLYLRAKEKARSKWRN